MTKTLLAPAVALMRRLKLAPKFGLVALSFLAPLLYLLFTVASDRQGVLAFTEREVLGIEKIRSLAALVEPSARWRGNTLGGATQVQGAAAARDQAARDVDQSLDALAKQLAAAGGDPLDLASAFKDLRAEWDAVKLEKPTDATAAMAVGTRWVMAVRLFLEAVTDQSNLSLDPDAESYYLMLAHTAHLPGLIDTMGRVRAAGRYLAASTAGPDAEMYMVLHNSGALAEEGFELAIRALEKSQKANPEALTGIDLSVLARIRTQVLDRHDKEFSWGKPPGAQPEEWFATYTAAIKELSELNGQLGVRLEALLGQREGRLRWAIGSALGISAVFVMLGVYLLSAFYSASTSSFAALGRRIAQMGGGT